MISSSGAPLQCGSLSSLPSGCPLVFTKFEALLPALLLWRNLEFRTPGALSHCTHRSCFCVFPSARTSASDTQNGDAFARAASNYREGTETATIAIDERVSNVNQTTAKPTYWTAEQSAPAQTDHLRIRRLLVGQPRRSLCRYQATRRS